jgi:hypothetical protein
VQPIWIVNKCTSERAERRKLRLNGSEWQPGRQSNIEKETVKFLTSETDQYRSRNGKSRRREKHVSWGMKRGERDGKEQSLQAPGFFFETKE